MRKNPTFSLSALRYAYLLCFRIFRWTPLPILMEANVVRTINIGHFSADGSYLQIETRYNYLCYIFSLVYFQFFAVTGIPPAPPPLSSTTDIFSQTGKLLDYAPTPQTRHTPTATRKTSHLSCSSSNPRTDVKQLKPHGKHCKFRNNIHETKSIANTPRTLTNLTRQRSDRPQTHTRL